MASSYMAAGRMSGYAADAFQQRATRRMSVDFANASTGRLIASSNAALQHSTREHWQDHSGRKSQQLFLRSYDAAGLPALARRAYPGTLRHRSAAFHIPQLDVSCRTFRVPPHWQCHTGSARRASTDALAELWTSINAFVDTARELINFKR